MISKREPSLCSALDNTQGTLSIHPQQLPPRHCPFKPQLKGRLRNFTGQTSAAVKASPDSGASQRRFEPRPRGCKWEVLAETRLTSSNDLAASVSAAPAFTRCAACGDTGWLPSLKPLPHACGNRPGSWLLCLQVHGSQKVPWNRHTRPPMRSQKSP